MSLSAEMSPRHILRWFKGLPVCWKTAQTNCIMAKGRAQTTWERAVPQTSSSVATNLASFQKQAGTTWQWPGFCLFPCKRDLGGFGWIWSGAILIVIHFKLRLRTVFRINYMQHDHDRQCFLFHVTVQSVHFCVCTGAEVQALLWMAPWVVWKTYPLTEFQCLYCR